MSIRHKYIVLLLVMVGVLSYPIRSYAYDGNRSEHVISNDRITLDQFNSFINLLGSHLADDTSSITSFYDTESHERNVVYIDGAPKWADVTWNDGLGWNKYLLADISQDGLDYINLPSNAYRFTP